MIYVFGDSHTAGIKHEQPLNLEYNYKVWPEFISEKLNIPLVNLAKAGQPLVENINVISKNLKEIIDNGKIVIFQFQFFHNAYLNFGNKNMNWKMAISADTHGGKNDFPNGIQEWDTLKKYNWVEDDDKLHITHWFYKFEERRQWIYMEIINNLFESLEKFGIKCYIFYWCHPRIISLIDTNRTIKFNKKDGTPTLVVQDLFNDYNITFLKDETNKIWNDGHLGTEGNKRLAELIYPHLI